MAQALAAQGGWDLHLVDVKRDEGARAARALPHTTFHHVDLRDYSALAAAFQAAFLAGGRQRLDFVFANAGFIEKSPLFDTAASDAVSDAVSAPDPAQQQQQPPPPRPDYTAVEINLQGAVDTVHLARHYMLRSPAEVRQGVDRGAIVVTASCSSVWPTYWAPIYSASKCETRGNIHFPSIFRCQPETHPPPCPAQPLPLLPFCSSAPAHLSTGVGNLEVTESPRTSERQREE